MRFRRLRVQDLLKEEISSILFQDIKDPGLGMGMITILEVKMTEDLKIARVYYSVYGSEEMREKARETLNRSKNYVKHLIGERIKLKYTPDIEFFYDDRFDKIARIEEILKKDRNARED